MYFDQSRLYHSVMETLSLLMLSVSKLKGSIK